MPLVPFPTRGDIFLDARGHGRALRVTGHLDEGVVVLSVWQGAVCTATIRLAGADSARLAEVLEGLATGVAPGSGSEIGDDPGAQAVAAR